MFNIAVLATVLGLANCVLIRPIPLTDGRIVNGEDVTIEEFPYQVSLQYFGSHLCGGTILSVRRVLTAAHCTYGAFPSFLTIRAGSTYRNSGGQVIKVSHITQNPWYDPYTKDYDISILWLQSSLTFGSGVQTISLAINLPPAGAVAVVSGWGTLAQVGLSLSSVLQAVKVNIVTQAACKAAYPLIPITTRMLCAYAYSKGSCKGDSGGPLVLQGTTTLVGIVSWGFGCAQPDYPDVYASIPNLRNWIEANV